MATYLPRRWIRQPPHVVGVDWNNPITRNLALARNGGQYELDFPRSKLEVTGTSLSVARASNTFRTTGFGTSGVGTTDALGTSVSQGATQRSFFSRWNRTGAGGNNIGRLLVKGNDFSLWVRSDNNSLALNAGWSTQVGEWSSPASGVAANVWYTTLWVYDKSSISNNPICYINGTSVTLTRDFAPSGSSLTNSDAYVIGNNSATGGIRQFDGFIGEVFVWNRLLSAQEARELHVNSFQIFRPAANQTFYSLPSPSQTAGTPQLGLWGDLPWAGLPAAGSVTQTLTPNRYDNTNQFFAPTVTRGAVTLTPNRYDNTSAFYTPTVTSSITLVPGRYDNAQTFYSPTVTVAGGLFPARYDNAQTFYTPTVTRGSVTLTPALFTQTSSYFSPTVTRGTITLTPSLYTNTSSFYAPVVTQGGAVLQPARYDNANTFYSPTVGVADFDIEVRLTNNAEASLASGVSTLDTVIVVQNTEGAVFPDLGTVGYFYATLTDAIGNYEIVKVSTRINDTMTVVRGQEGTLPIPFAAGSRFQILTTVGNSLAQFNDLDYLLF